MQITKTTIILTTAILLFTIIAAIGVSIATSGCLDFGGDDTTVTTSTDHIPIHEPIEPLHVEPETHVDTNITEPIVAEPVETAWYLNEPSFKDAEIGTYSTLFGSDIDCVKYDSINGGYTLYDKNEFIELLHHSEFDASYRLDLELSSDQYRELNAQYGTLVSATMETIDLDRDGTMDQVAIHYVGTGGEWEFKSEYHEGWRLVDYMYMELVK